MPTSQFVLLVSILLTFGWLQFSVFNIGNRQYSMHYKSHCLFKKKGILKLIYYKPKHYHRFSIWEVIAFFVSYIQLIVGLVLFCLGFSNETSYKIVLWFLIPLLVFVSLKIAYIDITETIEEKHRVTPKINEMNLNAKYNKKHAEWYNFSKSLRFLLDRIHEKRLTEWYNFSKSLRYSLDRIYDKRLKKINKKNVDSIDKLDDKFIQYYRDYKLICINNNKIIYIIDHKQLTEN